VSVFQYKARISKREDYSESGTVVARSEREAEEKVKELDFDHVRVKRIRGLRGLFKALTADIR